MNDFVKFLKGAFVALMVIVLIGGIILMVTGFFVITPWWSIIAGATAVCVSMGLLYVAYDWF